VFNMSVDNTVLTQLCHQAGLRSGTVSTEVDSSSTN
jgi:hypothetical protein